MKRWLLVVAACGPPAAHVVGPTGGGSGPPGADLGSATAPDEPPATPACIPNGDLDLDLGFAGDDLVVCAVERTRARGTIGCWDVDPATGEISARDVADLPGYGHRIDGHCAGPACWDEHDDSEAGHTGAGAWVATNPADRRVAVVAHGRLEVFDEKGASLSKRGLADTKAPKPALDDATVANVYFLGDTVYILARDATSASLYELPIGKPVGRPTRNLMAGGVGISRDHLVVHEQALSRLTVVDGRTQRVTKGRARHDDPCHPDASYGAGHEPSDGSACATFLAEHYRPYIDATIIAEGDGFYGVDPHARTVFVLDEHLAETSRVQMLSCLAR